MEIIMSDKNSKHESILNTLTKKHLSPERSLAALAASLMISYIIQMLINNSFFDLGTYYNSINFVVFWLISFVSLAVLCAVTYVFELPTLIPWALTASAVVLSCQFSAVYNSDGVYFMLGIALVLLVVVLWDVKDDKLQISKIVISHKTCFIAAISLLVITTVVFGYYTSLRYKNFQNATFDFGIFCQMFENMAKTGLPVTTLERSVEMSHFGVHFSPIFYLLLPLYYIFRSPLYLLYSQAFVVALGVIPVYLICKKLGLSGKVTLLFEIIYSFYPCLFNGCFYDFHENKFLTTIILFLFYFIISEKRIPTLLLSLMLLAVKEDAAIYLIVIALYVLITRKDYLTGVLMAGMSVIYFVVANRVVASLGTEGVMMWRLNDYFINGDESYMSVFKSVLFDVGYLIKMMFTADKFPFIIWMLLPVAFAPFMGKKISALVLLLPMIPINLMQSWQYQYNIDYQYTYGVAALVLFLSITAVLNMKKNQKRIALLMSVFMCIVMAVNVLMPKIKNNSYYESATSETSQDIEAALKIIPDGASVTAGHMVTSHLARISTLYTVPDYYKSIEQTDYFVTDTRNSEHVEAMKDVMGDDYTLISSAGFVNIYKHK